MGRPFHGVQVGSSDTWFFETGYVMPPGGPLVPVTTVAVTTQLGDGATPGLGVDRPSASCRSW